jgi:hypothetical protein
MLPHATSLNAISDMSVAVVKAEPLAEASTVLFASAKVGTK